MQNSSPKKTQDDLNIDNSCIQNLRDNNNFGVPQFLINKWLNIGNKKSKFIEKRCQIDNQDDVSVPTDTVRSSISSVAVTIQQKGARSSRFSIVSPINPIKKFKLSLKESPHLSASRVSNDRHGSVDKYLIVENAEKSSSSNSSISDLKKRSPLVESPAIPCKLNRSSFYHCASPKEGSPNVKQFAVQSPSIVHEEKVGFLNNLVSLSLD